MEETRQCLKCEKKFTAKRDNTKFCSVSCRVGWNRKNGEKKEKVNQAVLINTLLEKLSKVNFISISEPVFDSPKKNFGNYDEPPQYVEQKTVSGFDDFMIQLKDCRTITEIENVVKEIKVSAFLAPREKLMLENHAKDLSKEMYTD